VHDCTWDDYEGDGKLHLLSVSYGQFDPGRCAGSHPEAAFGLRVTADAKMPIMPVEK